MLSKFKFNKIFINYYSLVIIKFKMLIRQEILILTRTSSKFLFKKNLLLTIIF